MGWFDIGSSGAAAIIPLILFGIGISCRSRTVAAIAALTSVPYCWFISGYPLIGWLGWLALGGNFVSAPVAGIRRDVAFAALSPFMAIVVLLGVLALRGIRLVHP
jgi:hypothetical protein